MHVPKIDRPPAALTDVKFIYLNKCVKMAAFCQSNLYKSASFDIAMTNKPGVYSGILKVRQLEEPTHAVPHAIVKIRKNKTTI